MDVTLSRRQLLFAGAATLLLSACPDEGGSEDTADTSSTTSQPRASTTSASSGSTLAPSESAALTVADFTALGVCRLLPEQTSGPFPLDRQLDRRDVREGAVGQPMRLGFRVVDEACTGLPGAVAEIWHCDASGDYSAFVDGGGGKDEAEGTTFLRGSQTANDDGIVEFLSIVPGWYTGRAVHVHVRVHVDGTTRLTTQVYFDAEHLAKVYAAEPYAVFGPPDTSNADDGIAGDAVADGTVLYTMSTPTAAGPGTLALLNLGVDPTTV
jgi:protocatechuate 3,4-dioxygenase beta subunit